MSQVSDYLLDDGIAAFPGLYTDSEIALINTRSNQLLLDRAKERRSYLHVDELISLDLLSHLFTERMLGVLFSIMPDPVLYHCHISEIASNDTRSHIFGDSLAGWHRDPDSYYVEGDLTHFSIFVYLTNVGSDDGAFEFVPKVSPTMWVRNGTPYISAQGASGCSFAWHRSYFHRAAPNRGSVRRRLLKLSIQRNAFRSIHIGNSHFKRAIAQIPAGDARLDLLFGRYQGMTLPALAPLPQPSVASMRPNGAIALSNIDLAKAQLRESARVRARAAKRYLKRMLGKELDLPAAAYD